MTTDQDIIDRIAGHFASYRVGNSVFMDGSHNPTPSEVREARRLFDYLILPYILQEIETQESRKVADSRQAPTPG